MFQVVHKNKVLFRNASYARCRQFVLRHKLHNAIIEPLKQMVA